MKDILNLSTCPHCGQEDACIMGRIAREQIKLGNVGDDVVGHLMAAVYTMIDQRRPPLAGARIPAIRVFTDLCKKCGRSFNFLIEEGHATMPLRASDIPVFS